MKKILTILFLLVSLFTNAQLLGDTVKVVTNASHEQWFSSPYGVHKILAFSKIGFRPASYPAYLSLPTGLKTGELVWVEDSVRYAYWNSSAWVLMTPDGLGGVAGVSSFNTRTGAVTLTTADVTGVSGFVNGLNAFGANSTIGNSDNFALSIRTNNAARINITNAGAVSLPDGSLTVGGTTNGVINLQSSAASTRGSIDLSSNNPRLNSATGTWLFAQSGNTMGVYNGTGWFLGGGTAPSGFIFSTLAGTATLATYRMNLGVDLTTAVAGSFEYSAVSSINRLAFTATGTNRRRIPLTTDATPANGQVIIGNGTDFATANITSTGGSITVNNGAGTIDISTTLTLATGTYTPTITSTLNVSATSLAGTVYYQRIGNQVTVWGAVEIDVTSASTLTSIAISLPIASALTNYSQLTGFIGSGSSNTGVGAIVGDDTNDRAQCDFTCGTELASRAYSFRFTYEVL